MEIFQIYKKKINTEHYLLKKIVNNIKNIEKKIEDIYLFIDLYISAPDDCALSEINLEISNLENEIKKLEFLRMFSKQYDSLNCYVDLQAGSGGIDAQDWTKMLLRMYLKWSNSKNFKTEIIEESDGEVAGIKSATIKISGPYAFGWFRTESGVHRLVRRSPFNSNGRRHTSFCSVCIYPEINHTIDIIVKTSDLRIDVYRASGAGGQHVNKTESAVRITHLPSGTVTKCQNDRSQHKNKEKAIKQLIAKLHHIEVEKQKIEKKKKINNEKLNISWGSQIRSYVLDDTRIKDLRTGLEIRDVQSILNGKLDQFIETSLKLGV